MPGRTKSRPLPEIRKIRGLKIKLRRREILRHLKYDSRTGPLAPPEDEAIQKGIQKAYTLIYPSVVYKTLLRETDEFKSAAEKILLKSGKTGEIASSARALTFMAATAGDKIEEEINILKKENLSAAFILDAAGSEAAEQAVNFVSGLINRDAKEMECYAGLRVSPGYGGWEPEANKKIIKLLEAGKIGIKYLPSGIISPRKSVTAVQGWFGL